MIKQIDFFHGAAIYKLIGRYNVCIEKTNITSAYMYNGHPIYIKLNSSRISPWQFTFTEDHIRELEFLYKMNNELSIILICNDDGMVIMDYTEYNKVLSVDDGIYPKWIKASRKKREKYTVTGSDGVLNNKIGMERVGEFIEKHKTI